jgi:predicted regulator of Ras-like GTPase activity (Roadblock/LC7/MglB family)
MARSQMVLSAQQLQKLHACLAWLGRHASVKCGILVDLSGQDIAHWSALHNVDVGSIAALAAGDLLATMEIARMLGMRRTCNLITQEHDGQTIMIARVGEDLLLLIVAGHETPLGWVRMAVKRSITAMIAIIGTPQPTPAPQPQINKDFEAVFAAKLEQIW